MRRITSIVLAVVFILVSVTGVQMDFVQDSVKDDGKALLIQQGLADRKDSSIILIVSGNELHYPRGIHKITGYLFIVAGLVHLGLNIRPMLIYLRRKN